MGNLVSIDGSGVGEAVGNLWVVDPDGISDRGEGHTRSVVNSVN